MKTTSVLGITGQLGAVLTGLLLGGCSDPKFKEQQQVRDGRMREVWREFLEHERGGPERMKQVSAMRRDMTAKHAEQLKAMRKQIEERFDRDVRKWHEGRQERREQVLKLLEGQPDKIDDTFRVLAY